MFDCISDGMLEMCWNSAMRYCNESKYATDEDLMDVTECLVSEFAAIANLQLPADAYFDIAKGEVVGCDECNDEWFYTTIETELDSRLYMTAYEYIAREDRLGTLDDYYETRNAVVASGGNF